MRRAPAVPRPPASRMPHPLADHRLNWLLSAFAVALFLLTVRLFHIQVIKHPHYMSLDEEIHPGEAPTPPQPGAIYARGLEPLAESIQMVSLCADPPEVQDEGGIDYAARVIAEELGLDFDEVHGRLERGLEKKRTFVYLARLLPPGQADEIRDLGVEGVWSIREYRRIYPGGRLACHVLGRCSPFHEPMDGIEYRWRFLLAGLRGTWRKNVDCHGRIIPGEDNRAVLPSVPGKDIVLTIDRSLQRVVELALDACMKEHRPRTATCVVLDPQTGALLAVASRPGFNPNEPGRCTQETLMNLPVIRQYEPGSLFKVLLVAAVLESGRYDPSVRFYCGGTTEIGHRPLRCWGRWADNGGHGTLALPAMLVKSCNLVAARFALWLGADEYCGFLKRVGIGERTQVGMPGEAAGYLRPAKELSERDLANLGFGQGVAVTDIQMASAVAAVVNGGRLMQPHIVQAVADPATGALLREVKPLVRRRVCSEETSATVRRIMGEVVRRGTGARAQIEGVQVGGKTGTAQKWIAEAGGFVPGRNIVSFVLVTPLDEPRFVILVTADEPQVGEHGADVAAPVARTVALAALRRAGLLPEDVEINSRPHE